VKKTNINIQIRLSGRPGDWNATVTAKTQDAGTRYSLKSNKLKLHNLRSNLMCLGTVIKNQMLPELEKMKQLNKSRK